MDRLSATTPTAMKFHVLRHDKQNTFVELYDYRDKKKTQKLQVVISERLRGERKINKVCIFSSYSSRVLN